MDVLMFRGLEIYESEDAANARSGNSEQNTAQAHGTALRSTPVSACCYHCALLLGMNNHLGSAGPKSYDSPFA